MNRGGYVKRALKSIPILLIILLILMLITKPSDEKFENWLVQEYGINCDYVDYEDVCFKDGERIRFKSSHIRDVGIFASYELNYEFESGEKVTFRTLGILGVFFQMNDGYLWEEYLN